ncbi:hypothetical protein QYC42_09645 (plasmid) [Ligilactobacillus salivarius]|uniref:hypothetical protein n=1 Tax=Ligilactobacillus salivarius TaxID=1624 RepID=UPI0020237368|nr:hypothetical protein [Ligilactobacillus salivarius]MDN4849171.1 hypothetical protein [Ligilactobacillus salivarius]URI13849.1 hypothetical protein M9Y03_09245 [Ligilactobacillus salivarius]
MSLTTSEMEEKLKKIEEQEAKIKARKRKMKSQISAKKRKERTKRLIEKGAIIEKLQGKDAESIKPEGTLDWIKNNISSAKIKTLEEENKSLRDELQFFKNYAQRWNVNGENITKIISKAYLNNNNND